MVDLGFGGDVGLGPVWRGVTGGGGEVEEVARCVEGFTHAFDLGWACHGGLFVGVELRFDAWDGVFVCVGVGCGWDDEGVAPGVVAVVVGVDEGEGWLVGCE